MAELGVLYLATILVTISILIAGMAIGIGRAAGNKRIENFGYDELVQSIINGALIGAFAVIIEIVSSISTDAVKGFAECAPLGSADAAAKLSCVNDIVAKNAFLLLAETVKAGNILGYYQTLKLDFASFSIQPLANLASVSDMLSSQAMSMHLALVLLGLQLQILLFISQNTMQFLFPLGLAFRSFFATRRFGGYLIAISLGLFIFYPVFMLSFPTPQASVLAAHEQAANFTSNAAYATVPIIDLNGNNALAQKIDELSGTGYLTNQTNDSSGNPINTTVKFSNSIDMTSDITKSVQLNSDAISRLFMFAIIAPLFSFLVSTLFIKEAGNILGDEMISISLIRNV